MQGERFLITGANGFVGKSVVRMLRCKGSYVRAAVRDRRSGNAIADEVGDVAIVGEIGPDTDWRNALAGVNVIIHLAARAHVMNELEREPLGEFRRVNTAGTLRLAQQAVGHVQRFVFVSSIGINGDQTTGQAFTENSPPAPSQPYAISKYEAEQALLDLASKTGLQLVIVRPTLVYGPNNPGNVLRLLRLVGARIPLPFGALRNKKCLVYVENLASALLICATDPKAANRTYIVDDGTAISTPELLRTLGNMLDIHVRLFPFPIYMLRFVARTTGQLGALDKMTRSLYVDSSRIRGELNWKPQFTMLQGLTKTVEWFKTRQ